MESRHLLGFVVLWSLLLSQLQQVYGSGVFELKLLHFKNGQGVNIDGNCCSGVRRNGQCTSPCKTFFRICLKHYQANISPETPCTFGSLTTPVIGNNTFSFPLNLKSFTNPIRLPFEFSWPGTFSLIIEAWHDTTLQGPTQESPRELITRLAAQRSISVGEDWKHYVHDKDRSELQYSYRVMCDEGYYGESCSQHCDPRDDKFGHYTCSRNGSILCLEGWSGGFCDKPICLPGCHETLGSCEKPNECKCRMGWEGKFCNRCIRYPGCQHGKCDNQPWQCNCEEGWGGLFCNQDLNYCTHHSPCKHGSTCTNTGEGSYTCECQTGYTGTNCEIEMDDCTHQPCFNGGTCTDTGTDYVCRCPPGFNGRHCESSAKSCDERPCQNRGTCTPQPEGYYCSCPAGFTGINCEAPVDECSSNPCLNHGRCVDQPNGFQCHCLPGFRGNRCEENVNDCTTNPCMNGGTCKDLVNEFECRCVPGFTGRLCQENVDDCDLRPCANGGTCHDLINDFMCSCAPGFHGTDCRYSVKECITSPCLHGGTCREIGAGYQCDCVNGYYGRNCGSFGDQSRGSSSQETDVRTTQDTNGATDRSTLPILRDASAITMQQLLLIICLGVGIPILVIIGIIVFLLCQRRRNHDDRIRKENEQNEITNMNNKNKCIDTNIINTLPPSNVCLKITNEEQDSKTNNIRHKNYLNIDKPTNKNYSKDLNAKNTRTKDILDDRDFVQRSSCNNKMLDSHSVPASESGCTSLISPTAPSVDISDYNTPRDISVDVHVVKPVNQPANSNNPSIFFLEKHSRHHPYSEGMLATEV